MEQVILELENIAKSFGDTEVLKKINLKVMQGEFVTLLGSSGCGKTTTLRIIAGLEAPDRGAVLIDGTDMTDKAPNMRPVNTVFQNYALFPHMNVFNNIAYGLKLKKVSKGEIKERVTKMLDLVQLNGFEKRMPSEMSGGQRQRVAIARALINNPKVLLLDEPLGALDLQLRRQMQIELKKLQQKLGITFIYITHDQEEAINMSDRIIVMRDGYFEQQGTPSEVYDHPKTSYVATFVGSANVLCGTVVECKEDMILLESGDGTFVCSKEGYNFEKGMSVKVAVRSENVNVWKAPKAYGIQGVVTEKSFVGGMLRIVVKLLSGEEIVVRRHGINFSYEIGETVYLEWSGTNAVPVDREELQSQENKENDAPVLTDGNGKGM